MSLTDEAIADMLDYVADLEQQEWEMQTCSGCGLCRFECSCAEFDCDCDPEDM